jgi:hypothetical protein
MTPNSAGNKTRRNPRQGIGDREQRIQGQRSQKGSQLQRLCSRNSLLSRPVKTATSADWLTSFGSVGANARGTGARACPFG